MRVALLEANNFHEETIFALAGAALAALPGAALTVYAPDHWASRDYLQRDLGAGCRWLPFDAAGSEPPDLVLVNTFPSPRGQRVVERLLATGVPVLGLVHDVDVFAGPVGAAALAAHPGLVLAHAGVVPPPGVDRLPAPLRRRVLRLVPVFPAVPAAFASLPAAPAAPDGVAGRAGVVLPGALEYARRDFGTALALTARAGTPLAIVGRSTDHGDGPKLPRDLDAERARLLAAIAAAGAAGLVAVSTDVSCRDFYRTVGRGRFVGVLPAQPAYLAGKLTGAVTAAVSAGVPMLATAAAHAHYTGAHPAFAACMLPFDPAAAAGAATDWGTLVDLAPDRYHRLCAATAAARDALLAENVAAVRHAAGEP